MTAVQDEASDLAQAIMTGVGRRPVQSFGEYFGENGGSDALGANGIGATVLPAVGNGETEPEDGFRASPFVEAGLKPVD